jgi:hypothetical protein
MSNSGIHLETGIIILYPSTYRKLTVIHLLQIQQAIAVHCILRMHELVLCDVQVYPPLKYA